MSDHFLIDKFIEQSSLGAPGVRHLCERASSDAVQAVLRLLSEGEREVCQVTLRAERAANCHDVDEVEACLDRMVDVGLEATAVSLAERFIQEGKFGGSETWWRRRAADGNSFAAGRLGLMLAERGELAEAEIYLRQAAEAGEENAARYLAELLTRQGNHEALIWWGRAAKEGDSEARETWWRQMAADGDTLVAGRLGLMLAERGELAEAEIYLRQAAEAGEENAARHLAELLMRRDDHEALVWWGRAAQEGDSDARQILIKLIEIRRGRGPDCPRCGSS